MLPGRDSVRSASGERRSFGAAAFTSTGRRNPGRIRNLSERRQSRTQGTPGRNEPRGEVKSRGQRIGVNAGAFAREYRAGPVARFGL